MKERPALVILTRTLVIATAAVGIAVGSLTSARASFAEPAPISKPAVSSDGSMTSFAVPAPTSESVASSEDVVPLAVVNLGLSTTQAKYVQCWLRANWGYTGAIDGLLGTNSWKAFQRNLKAHWGYTGPIDGIVGSGTIKALQRLLKYGGWGYTGPIDGIAGSGTQAAFKRFADACSGWC